MCSAGRSRLMRAQQLLVVGERQPGVQPVDDVDLGQVGGARTHLANRLVDGHGVGAGHALLQARERAELAVGDADVGRVEVHVDVEVGAIAVQPLAHAIGERAERAEIALLQERARRRRTTVACRRRPWREPRREMRSSARLLPASRPAARISDSTKAGLGRSHVLGRTADLRQLQALRRAAPAGRRSRRRRR